MRAVITIKDRMEIDLRDIHLEEGTIVFETDQGPIKASFNDVREVLVPGVVLGSPTYLKLATIKFLLKFFRR